MESQGLVTPELEPHWTSGKGTPPVWEEIL